MLPSAACLLAMLAFLVSSVETQSCYSTSLGRYFASGQTWTEPPCAQVGCDKGSTYAKACPLVFAGPGYWLVKGTSGAAYPGCCLSVVPANSNDCYFRDSQLLYRDGEVFTTKPCARATCRKGGISAVGCPWRSIPPGCKEVKGIPNAEYPLCCRTIKC